MSRVSAALSRAMLILGGLLVLLGVSWGLWEHFKAPPEPILGDAGAVVLAVTAPSLRASPSPSTPVPTTTPTPAHGEGPPEPTEAPTEPLYVEGPAPELLPDWSVTPGPRAPGQGSPATAQPLSTPQASATPLATVTIATAQPSHTPQASATPLPKANEPPTRIVAPAIKLDAKVVPMGWELVDHKGVIVSEWVVPKKVAGWHVNSGLPGHGENVVLSGHHNIEGKVFRYVVDLQPGDSITLYVGNVPYVYSVTEKYILKEAGMPLQIRQKNAQWIMPTGDERLTLVTCWPYEWPGNTHRVIVVARPAGELGLESRSGE